jgi:Zn/Cd-binding protein ZinT
MLGILDKVFDISANTDDDQTVGAARKKIEGELCADVDKITKTIIETKSLEFLRKNKSTLMNYYIPPNIIGKKDSFSVS